jgi:hypothetical protein
MRHFAILDNVMCKKAREGERRERERKKRKED